MCRFSKELPMYIKFIGKLKILTDFLNNTNNNNSNNNVNDNDNDGNSSQKRLSGVIADVTTSSERMSSH